MQLITKKLAKYSYLTALQFAIILLPMALFYDAALLFRGRMNLSVAWASVAFVLLNGGVLVCAVLAFVMRAGRGRLLSRGWSPPSEPLISHRALLSRRAFISHLPLLLVVLLFIVLALLQFDSIQLYDSSLYYSSLIAGTNSFHFGPLSLLSSFCLENHPTQGFAFLIAIGEMLLPKQSVGVYAVTLVLTVTALFCLYGIMGKIFPSASSFIKAAGVAVFAFCPYVLGLFSYTTPDYYLTMLFVIMIWCFAVKLDYLAAFLSILVCFSKETGILFAAAFLLSAMFVRIWANWKSEGSGFIRSAFHYLLPKRLIVYAAAPVLLVLYYKFSGNISFEEASTKHSPLIWDSSAFHCFGINYPNIVARLSQGLVYNLFWVVTLLGLTAAFVFLFRHCMHTRRIAPARDSHFRADEVPQSAIGHKEEGDKSEKPAPSSAAHSDFSVSLGIIVSSGLYLLFLCLFMTNLCPRYSVCYALPISLISVLSITCIFRNKVVSGILLSCLAALFLAQSYTNIDPILANTCPKISIGYQNVYSPTEKSYGDRFALGYLGEMYVYNRTYACGDDLIEKAFKKAKISKNDHFLYVVTDWFVSCIYENTNKSNSIIYWDPVNQRRTYNNKAEGTFVPQSILCTKEGLLSGATLNLTDDFYFLLPAQSSDEYVKAIEKRGYTVTDSFVVQNSTGYITVYHMRHSTFLQALQPSSPDTQITQKKPAQNLF